MTRKALLYFVFPENVIQSQDQNMTLRYVLLEAPDHVSSHLLLGEDFAVNPVLHKLGGGRDVEIMLSNRPTGVTSSNSTKSPEWRYNFS